MKRLFTTSIVTIFLAGTFGVFFASPVQAASSIYLSPASKTIDVGDALSVQVRVNSGSVELRGAQTYIAYPTNKLKFVSIDTTGSAFPLGFVNQESEGVVQIARTSTTPVSGDKLIATVNFTAEAAGSAALNFTADTYLTKFSDSTEESSTKTGGNYTIKIKSTPGNDPGDGGDTGGSSSGDGSTSTGSTGTSTSTGSDSTTTTKKDTKVPTVSDVNVTNIDFKAATITWKTNEKATSVVEYGPTKDLGLVEFNNTLKTSHKISLAKKFLSPGVRVYYKVRSKDEAGNSASSKLTSFKTKGFSIKLKITNLEGKALEDVKVTLVPGFDTATTDKGGFAVFTDVAPGKHSVNVEVGEQTLASSIEVAETEEPEKAQEFEIQVAAEATTRANDLLGIGALVTIVVLAGAAVVMVWFFRNHLLTTKRVVITSLDGAAKKDGSSPSNKGSTPSTLPPKPASSQVNKSGTTSQTQENKPQTQAPSSQNTEAKPLMPRNEPKLDAVKWGKKK